MPHDSSDEFDPMSSELELLLANLPAAILVYEGDGTLQRVNHMAAESLGSDPEGLVGRNIAEFRGEEHEHEFNQIDDQLRRTGEPVLSRDFVDTLPSGDIRVLSTSWVPVMDGERLDRVYSMAVDVTEQRAVSRELFENETRLRALNEQLTISSELSAVGYWRIDIRENALFWSDQTFRIHAADPESFSPDIAAAIGFYHPDDRAMVQTVVAQAMSSKEPFEFDARIVRTDGETRFVRTNSTVLLDNDGELVSVLGAIQDVTDDRQRETDLEDLLAELSRSNEELSRFSYVCSHDMKEPVRMIEAMSELLLQPDVKGDDVQRDELVTRIHRNTIRLRSIIDSLLAYSRLEARIDFSEVDLGDVVADIIETTAQLRHDTGATITHEGLPVVIGARVHFVQLLQNLIINALKYTDTDEPRVTISAKTCDDEHIILIEDNGPGIPTDQRAKAFDLFGRLDSSRGIEGVGVGLAICNRIVAQYDGRIEATESSMGGAAFTITLPFKPAIAETE